MAMSEDRLERALHEMKEEDVDAGTLQAARGRVWRKVTSAGSATCAEFRQDFRAYLGNELGGASWWKTTSVAAPAVVPR
jgi:hypothetical protein